MDMSTVGKITKRNPNTWRLYVEHLFMLWRVDPDITSPYPHVDNFTRG